MQAFRDVVEEVKKEEFKLNTKGNAIVQSERNELKFKLTDALALALEEVEDIDVVQVQKGIAILLPNDIEGSIPVEIQIITKPLDYDVDGLHQEYLEKQAKE